MNLLKENDSLPLSLRGNMKNYRSAIATITFNIMLTVAAILVLHSLRVEKRLEPVTNTETQREGLPMISADEDKSVNKNKKKTKRVKARQPKRMSLRLYDASGVAFR